MVRFKHAVQNVAPPGGGLERFPMSQSQGFRATTGGARGHAPGSSGNITEIVS